MSRRNCFVFTAVALSCLFSARSEFITKCKSEDTKCSKASAQAVLPAFAAGLPEYNVKKMDPMTFKEIDASSSNLKLILSDITVTGLKDCLVKKLKRDKSEKKILLKLQCTCQLEGQYDMKGRILILPIEGKGPVHATLRKAEVSIEADMGEIEINGATHWDVKAWRHGFTLQDKSTVVFENLFDGNEDLGKAARELLSNNGNEVVLEIGPPVVKAAIDEVMSNVNAFFHKVPANLLSED